MRFYKSVHELLTGLQTCAWGSRTTPSASCRWLRSLSMTDQWARAAALKALLHTVVTTPSDQAKPPQLLRQVKSQLLMNTTSSITYYSMVGHN